MREYKYSIVTNSSLKRRVLQGINLRLFRYDLLDE